MSRGRQLRNPRDLVVGVAYIVLGAGFSVASLGYEMGTASRMDAGYFPFWLGVVLAGLGAVVSLRALSPHAPRTVLERWDLRSLLWMVGAVALFGATLRPLGLVLSLALLVVLSSMASRAFTWRGALLNATVLVALNLGVFVYGLSLPFPVWPAFLGH